MFMRVPAKSWRISCVCIPSQVYSWLTGGEGSQLSAFKASSARGYRRRHLVIGTPIKFSPGRRTFVEAEKSAPEIARVAVVLMDAQFAVKRQAKDISVSERLELRQKQSVPILAELHRKLLIWKEPLIPKHLMADAVNYTLGQWQALTVFTTDGAVPIDNNVSEREMKRVVLNRKNSLFVGNPRGVSVLLWAYSLILLP